MKRITAIGTLILVIMTIGGTAFAQSNTFMLVPNIPGSSQDARHQNWIDVSSLRQTWPTASDRKDAAGCAIEVVKTLDVSGPRLGAAAVTGQVFGEIRIEVANQGENDQVYYKITLTNAFISQISTDGSNVFAESLTLGASAVTLSFAEQNPDGTLRPPVVTTVSCS
jgi:type VI secretion system Hcp family effector